MSNPYEDFSTRKTPQSEPIPGRKMVENAAGGYVFPVDDWTRLDRFLVLGSEGGTYYVGQRELTRDNALAALRCIAEDGVRVVNRVVEISTSGRAPKNDPALFVLAMAAGEGDESTRRAAFEALPAVARIGTHLFSFLTYAGNFGGMGRRSLRNALGKWYQNRDIEKLAYQLVKYQQRGGWSQRDVLRLAHPKPASPLHNALFGWVVKGELELNGEEGADKLRIVQGFEEIKKAGNLADAVRLVKEYRLPRECVPTEFQNDKRMWEALLEAGMGQTALIRVLNRMTAAGLLAPMSSVTKDVTALLTDEDRLRRGRVHPLSVLLALKTYGAGRGFKGKLTWTPVREINDALDDAFYRCFQNVAPTGKRILLALDISGSMGGATIAGTHLTAREAAAAMAMVTARTETDYCFVGFTAEGGGGWYNQGRAEPLKGYWAPSGSRAFYGTGVSLLDISAKQRLKDVIEYTARQPMGGTDCALPFLYALEKGIEADAVVVLTDNETWAGQDMHPDQALAKYRRETGISTKAIAVGMTATNHSIFDDNDAGSMNVVGFDAAAPQLMSDFIKD